MLKPVMMSDKVLYMKYNGLLKPVMFYKEEGGQYIDTIYDAQGNPVNPRTLVSVDDNRFKLSFRNNADISGDLMFDELTEIGNNSFSDAFLRCNLITSVSFPSLTNISGDNGFDAMFSSCTSLTSVSFPNLTTISGKEGCYGMFNNCSNLTSVSFPNLTEISGYGGCELMFGTCTNLTSVSFPSLTTVSGMYGCDGMFRDCTNLISVSLPNLTTISGTYGCDAMFGTCENLTSVSFPRLNNISGRYGCNAMFVFCPNLEHIYFPALTTTSFGDYTDQFGILPLTGTSKVHTIHFPSNLESTISQLDYYPLFGGEMGYVTLAFDLPATE